MKDAQDPASMVIFTTDDNSITIDVKIEHDTVWLSQSQMATLFQKDRTVISRHIRNIYNEGELHPNTTCAKIAHMGFDQDQTYETQVYNLDVIISVGYRVKSAEGVCFRMWANQVLRNYMLNGVSVNQRMIAMEDRVDRRLSKQDADIVKLRQDVDFFISSSLPPKEKVFVEGKMLDAQVELTRIVKMAKSRIVLIDNYIDERTLMLLGNRREKVSCMVYTLKPNSPKLTPALKNYASEFPSLPIALKGYKKSHDRFLIIDDDVYMLGNSVKDFGNAWGAVIKMEMNKKEILAMLEKE